MSAGGVGGSALSLPALTRLARLSRLAEDIIRSEHEHAGLYGLSMQGWMHRARDLGILSDGHYRSLVKMFSVRGWRKKEPGEDYPREEPKLFEQLVFRTLAEDLISESKAAELMNQPLMAFRKLRDMGNAVTHQ